jgi:hypothetical protein
LFGDSYINESVHTFQELNMRTLNEYRENRQQEELAALIVEAGLDPAEFCDYILEVASHCQTEEELYNELWGGLRQLGGALGQGAMGLARQGAGAVGGAMQRGAQAVGNAASAVGNKVGQAASAVGDRVGQAASAAQQGLQKAGQWAGDQYQSGEMIGQMQKAQKQVTDLKSSLEQMGFQSPMVQRSIDLIMRELQSAVGSVQGDRSQRFGAGSNVFGRFNAPAQA